MKTAYTIFRILAVIFGVATTLNILDMIKGNAGSDFLPAFSACITFIVLSIYFGRKNELSSNETASGKKKDTDIKNAFNRKSYKNFIIAIIIVCIFFILFFMRQSGSDNSTATEQKINVESLNARLNEILELENKHDFEKIYDNYFSPETKDRLEKDAYLTEAISDFDNKIYSSEIVINDTKIDGDIGYIDRTRIDCLDKECSTKNHSRSYKKYIYINNDWYMVVDAEPIFCTRNTGYEMPEEFKRALSLIIQRYNQSDYASVQRNGYSVQAIQNCLNIQYADSSDDISGADGVFIFTPSQSLDKFDIFVSPKYAAKDDLLTSVLLIHEIYHVFDFINGQSSGQPVGCFESEAKAFSNQNFFVSHVLNSEEINSLNSRIYTNSSEEVRQISYVFKEIPRTEGNNYQEKALNFVKASPAYQEQCKDRQ